MADVEQVQSRQTGMHSETIKVRNFIYQRNVIMLLLLLAAGFLGVRISMWCR